MINSVLLQISLPWSDTGYFRHQYFLPHSSLMFGSNFFYSDSSDTEAYKADMELLSSHGIILYTLPRLLDNSIKLSFAEMALLKITPWSFTQYQKIQYIDGDVCVLNIYLSENLTIDDDSFRPINYSYIVTTFPIYIHIRYGLH